MTNISKATSNASQALTSSEVYLGSVKRQSLFQNLVFKKILDMLLDELTDDDSLEEDFDEMNLIEKIEYILQKLRRNLSNSTAEDYDVDEDYDYDYEDEDEDDEDF